MTVSRVSDFRDGDIVEVSPDRPGLLHQFKPFQGVVDSRDHKGMKSLEWVYVRKFGDPSRRAGGWYPSQCRRVARPAHHPSLPIPSNIVLSDN